MESILQKFAKESTGSIITIVTDPVSDYLLEKACQQRNARADSQTYHCTDERSGNQETATGTEEPESNSVGIEIHFEFS